MNEGMGDCDWGDCDNFSIGVRNDKDGHGWLPVCRRHYDEAREDERALHGTYKVAEPVTSPRAHAAWVRSTRRADIRRGAVR